jgi:hypothetical protein
MVGDLKAILNVTAQAGGQKNKINLDLPCVSQCFCIKRDGSEMVTGKHRR